MKILIVDDSKVILKMAQDIIESQQLCKTIDIANNGEKCLALMADQVYDVVLLDIVMPGISGLEVLSTIKEKGYLNTTKVVMFTSLSDRNALKNSFEMGAFDYISKPIEPIEFVARVKGALLQKQLEESLYHQIQETKRKNVELKSLYEELQKTQTQMIQREQMAGIGQLAAGVAHEINNPLGYIKGNYDVMKGYLKTYSDIVEGYKEGRDFESHVDKSQLEFIEEDTPGLISDMGDGLNRIMKIVEGIRTFSRVDALSTMELYDLNAGIESILILTTPEQNDIICEAKFGDIPEIEVMAADVNQSIFNILKNSFQAFDEVSRTEKKITIETYKKDAYVYCVIEDNGCGISEDIIDDVFNPFFTTKAIGTGPGLGLSVVYETVVNTHQGIATIESIDGKGTKVTVGLPIVFSGLQA